MVFGSIDGSAGVAMCRGDLNSSLTSVCFNAKIDIPHHVIMDIEFKFSIMIGFHNHYTAVIVFHSSVSLGSL